jgi:hypothetical protein
VRETYTANVLHPAEMRTRLRQQLYLAAGPDMVTRGPDFYDVPFTPKDPATAARQLRTEVPEGSVPNAIEGFELKKLGMGRIFERSADELSAGKAAGKNLPKFYGHALVLLPAGPRYIDIAAWHRTEHNFYSGSATLHDREAAAEARAVGVGRPGRATRIPQNG